MPLVTLGIVFVPWNRLDFLMIISLSGSWIIGAAISMMLIGTLRRTKAAPLIYFIMIASVFVFMSLGIRVHGRSLNLAYLMGVMSALNLYNLIFGPVVADKYDKKITSLKTPNDESDGLRRNSLKSQTRTLTSRVRVLDKCSGEFHTGQIAQFEMIFHRGASELDSSKISLEVNGTHEEFWMHEFLEKRFKSGNVIEPCDAGSESIFSLVYQKDHDGSDLVNWLDESSYGNLIFFYPDRSRGTAIELDESQTSRFFDWVEGMASAQSKA
ncbi:hypothetical protein [Kocuria massiliensis]|uniref:hypothetical protein n=1 Tax=Kocuria massiliensis TaxID=1926282 RepID=UPI00117ADE6C|nr:hypothetical protein [Kocuria massiliensis]